MWHWNLADKLRWEPNLPCGTWSLEQAKEQIELTTLMQPETPVKHPGLHSPAPV